MDAKQAAKKLADLRYQFQMGVITADEARIEAKPYLEVYNARAKEIAEKYGRKPELLGKNIIFWPQNA